MTSFTSLATTTEPDLDTHLEKLGVRPGMALVVHAKLLSFGRIDGGAAAVVRVLKRALGTSGTLAVPTYTLGLGPDDAYDPETTPSEGTGNLSEYVRTLPGVQRSLCPMHGHAASGPLATAAAAADPERSLGPGSAFQTMHEAGFQLLLLGCSFHEGATFIHHVEATVGVPYREWLKLPRKRRDADGQVRDVTCHYYGRRDSLDFRHELSPVEQAMRSSGRMTSIRAPYGESHFLSLDDLSTCVAEMLASDPYCLVERASEHDD